MKANDLIRVINKLVEKKINSKIKQLIKEEVSSELNKAMGKMIVEMVNKSKNSFVENIQEESPIHTKNPKLNSVLAETARNFQPLKRTGNLAELIDGGFDKTGGENDEIYTNDNSVDSRYSQPIQQDGSNLTFLKSVVSEGTTTGYQRSVLGTDAVPDVLKGVFNKNFRDVMKKIDETHKTGGTGLINPGSVISS